MRLVALDLSRETTFDLSDVQRSTSEAWSNYIRGVAAGLLAAGYPVRGFDGLIQGDVPIGSGLSSSAAMEMASVQAFSAIGRFVVPSTQAARIGQKAEHVFVGANTGLMDQLASALGQPDHVLLIDCRDSELPAGVQFPPALQSSSPRTASGARWPRRPITSAACECEAAAQALGVPVFRDGTLAMLDAVDLPDVVARRARHVIAEDERVLETVAALESGDLHKVGLMMDASHASLRDLYEVSSVELDTIVELLRSQPGCYGARLTGAGFGGARSR